MDCNSINMCIGDAHAGHILKLILIWMSCGHVLRWFCWILRSSTQGWLSVILEFQSVVVVIEFRFVVLIQYVDVQVCLSLSLSLSLTLTHPFRIISEYTLCNALVFRFNALLISCWFLPNVRHTQGAKIYRVYYRRKMLLKCMKILCTYIGVHFFLVQFNSRHTIWRENVMRLTSNTITTRVSAQFFVLKCILFRRGGSHRCWTPIWSKRCTPPSSGSIQQT